jgi:two-component system, LytTR family, sensor kinase
MIRPISSPPAHTIDDITELEHVLFTNIARAHELVRSLEVIDISRLSQSLQVRYHAAHGFYQNLCGNHSLAEKCYKKAVSLKAANDQAPSLSVMKAHLAGVLLNLGRMEDSELILEDAVKSLEDQAPATDFVLIQVRRAFVLLHSARYDQAISLFFQSIETLKHDTPEGVLEAYIVSMAYSGIGEVHLRNDDPAKCKAAFLQCLDICEKNGIQVRIGWHYLNAATCLLNESDLDQAKFYFKRALEVGDHPFVIANANANIGIAYLRDRKYEQALEHLEAAEKVYGEPNTPELHSNISVVLMYRSEICLAQGQDEAGVRLLERAFILGMRGNNGLHLINVCKRLSHLHAKKGEYRQAYEYQTHAEDFTKKYNEQLRDTKIRELQIRHDAIQKEKAAALAQAELAALQLRSLRAQFNPHFMFNALNGLANMISAGRNEDAEELLHEFSIMLRMSLDLSNEEWIPLEKELEFATLYMQMQKRLKFRGNMDFQVIMPKGISSAHYQMPSMMLQPFIENAVEHGLNPNNGGSIVIKFKMTSPQLLSCTIEDNGIGIHAAQKLSLGNRTKHKSRGMQFTIDRLKMLLGMQGTELNPLQLEDLMETESRAGTRVTLLIPVRLQ